MLRLLSSTNGLRFVFSLFSLCANSTVGLSLCICVPPPPDSFVQVARFVLFVVVSGRVQCLVSHPHLSVLVLVCVGS